MVPTRCARSEDVKTWHAKRFADKMQHRAEDKITIRKGRWLATIAGLGVLGMMVDMLLLNNAPRRVYAYIGAALRLMLSLNSVVLIYRLYDYYTFVFERKKTHFPPTVRRFWQARQLRFMFLLEALVAALHPLPSAVPLNVPRIGECRLGGFGSEATLWLSSDCKHVFSGFFGLLMFLRLVPFGLRVLRDSTVIWRMRSVLKSAATARFAYYPDVRVHATFMWQIHTHPARMLTCFFAISTLVLSFILYTVEARQENCDEDIFTEDGVQLMGIMQPDQRCSAEGVRSWLQAVWVICSTILNYQSASKPSSHVGRLACILATIVGICIESSMMAIFSRAIVPNQYDRFALEFLQHREARRRVTKCAAIYLQRHWRCSKELPEYQRQPLRRFSAVGRRLSCSSGILLNGSKRRRSCACDDQSDAVPNETCTTATTPAPSAINVNDPGLPEPAARPPPDACTMSGEAQDRQLHVHSLSREGLRLSSEGLKGLRQSLTGPGSQYEKMARSEKRRASWDPSVRSSGSRRHQAPAESDPLRLESKPRRQKQRQPMREEEWRELRFWDKTARTQLREACTHERSLSHGLKERRLKLRNAERLQNALATNDERFRAMEQQLTDIVRQIGTSTAQIAAIAQHVTTPDKGRKSIDKHGAAPHPIRPPPESKPLVTAAYKGDWDA